MGMPAHKYEALPSRAPSRRRSSPARRRAPGRRRAPAPARPGRSRGLVGRTAHVVTGLPESTAVRSVSRSRVWIGLIGLLLIGIVAINVLTVSYGSMASQIETDIEKLERRNAILSSSTTRALSMPRVRNSAVAAGMAVPATDEIKYRQYGPEAIAAAAQRLAAEGG